MALIEVNHKTLREVASAIETYCAAQDKEMRAAHADIRDMLATGWTGLDAREFGSKWEQVEDKDAVATKLKASMLNLRDILNASADAYKKAQEDAYNAAWNLPKFFTW